MLSKDQTKKFYDEIGKVDPKSTEAKDIVAKYLKIANAELADKKKD